MKRAIVYHAHCRTKYSDAAVESARSAKKCMPDVDTVLITSLPVRSHRFDRIVRIENPGLVNAQFPPLLNLPPEYGSAIYMDCITRVCASLYSVFDLVEDPRTDIALVHTSGKEHDTRYPSPGVPELFPHWRSAFIGFQYHDRMRRFFADWERAFHEHRERYAQLRAGKGLCHPDQKSMRIALYHSDLNIVTLRLNYSCPIDNVVIRGTVRMMTGNGDILARATEANREAPHLRFLHNGKCTRL